MSSQSSPANSHRSSAAHTDSADESNGTGAKTASDAAANAPSDLVLLVRDPIDNTALIRHVRAATDGAIVTFDGCVRNHSHGRATLYLDYEAYESMALAQMREIARNLRASFSIDRVAIAHRLGRLEIGETSVFIAISAPHRPAAFDACRFAIDTLKRTVPIWKKEYFADGAVWADGELPPPPSRTPAPKAAS